MVTGTNGTGFMIAPGVLVTTAHMCHINNDFSKPLLQKFQAIRSPDVGQKMELITLIAEDIDRDLALLKIENPRCTMCVQLECGRVQSGRSVGSLGFPLSSMQFTQSGRNFNLFERFQGASISAYIPKLVPSGHTTYIYETDSLMYSGSSGCPGFLVDGRVFGMHISSIIVQSSDQSDAANQSIYESNRLAISIWVPSEDIKNFAKLNGIQI